MGECLKVTTFGQGPDLVLLHGWAMHSGIWGQTAAALAADFRVNLVDLPGHGINRNMPLSSDLSVVAEQILSAVPPAAWLGWSLGGLVTLAAAFTQPDKVNKMALVAATPAFSKQPDWDCGVDKASRQGFCDGIESDYEETITQFCTRTFGSNYLSESLQRLGGLPINENRPSRQALRAGLHLLYSNNLLPGLGSCKIPTLFLGGSRDRTINPESFERAAKLMPAARSLVIRGAGHSPFISHEEKFLKSISEFLHGARAA